MDASAWKRGLIDEDEELNMKWPLSSLQIGGNSGSLVSPLTVDNAFSKFLQSSPIAEVDEEANASFFTGALDRLRRFEATNVNTVPSPPPPPVPSKDITTTTDITTAPPQDPNAPPPTPPPRVPSKEAVTADVSGQFNDISPSSDGRLPALQTRSEPSTPLRIGQMKSDGYSENFSDLLSQQTRGITRPLPRRTVSISATRMRLKLDIVPPASPALKRASTVHAPASPLVVTPESRPMSAHSPINDDVVGELPRNLNLAENTRFVGPERGRTGIFSRPTSPAREEHIVRKKVAPEFSAATAATLSGPPLPSPSPSSTPTLTRKRAISRSRSRKQLSTKSRPTTPGNNDVTATTTTTPVATATATATATAAPPATPNGSRFLETLPAAAVTSSVTPLDETNTPDRDESNNIPEQAHPRVLTAKALPAFSEHSKAILSPESVQLDTSLTPQAHHIHLTEIATRTGHSHTSSTISLRSRSQSVPVAYPSMSPSPPKPPLPTLNSSPVVPTSTPAEHPIEAYPPLTPVTPPPSFARPPKLPIHGQYPDPAGFPSPPSYPPVPGLVASGSSSTSARSSAYTSSGASAPLSSTDLSTLGAGFGSFENREESHEMPYVEDKEWELGSAITGDNAMPSSYSTSASYSRPLVREASEGSIGRLPFAINSSTAVATVANSSPTWLNDHYPSSIHNGNGHGINPRLDGSPTPFVRSDQYYKRSLPSTWRNAEDCDTDPEHDQSESHPSLPLVMNYISQRARAGTAPSSRSASMSGLTSASEDETDADEYPYPIQEINEEDEEARTAAIVVAEEGRGLIVHGEGQDVSAVNIPNGTTHLLLTSSVTPSLIPSLLSQTLPNIAQTLLALDISNNHLGVLPPALAHCTQLTELNIANNPLHALPSWLSNLEDLRVLIADATGITTLPSELAALKALNVLSIRRNKMMSLPPWLAFLTTLEQLEVEGNPFQGPWKALLSPLITARQLMQPNNQNTSSNESLKSKAIYPRRDHSLYGPGLSMYADTSTSHLSILHADPRPQILTPSSASFTNMSSESESPSIPMGTTDQEMSNGRRFISEEEDNTIVPRILTSSSKTSLPVLSPGLTPPPISPAPLTGNSQLSFSTSLNSPSLLPYTSSPVSPSQHNSSSDIEEALADIGKNTPNPIQRVPTFSVSDRRTPSPYLRPLSRNKSTPSRSRLSAGSANGSIATFIADQGNSRSRTSSAASQRPLTDYTSSRYNQRSVEDSGYYGSATEYGSYQRQSEGSDFFGGLRSSDTGASSSKMDTTEEERKKELRRMRSADELRRALEPVIGPSEPMAPAVENDDDDNGGETTETDRRPPFFAQKLDTRPKLSQLHTTDIGTVGPASSIILNDRLSAKKYSSLSAAQGLSGTSVQRRRPTLGEGFFDADAGVEADGEDEEKRKTQVFSGSSSTLGKAETPQKQPKGKWGFLKKMSMGRMRPDPPVPRLPQPYGSLSSRSTQASPESAVAPRPQLPSTPVSANSISSRPRAATRNVLSPMPPLSAGPSRGSTPINTVPQSPSLTVPPATSRAAKRRSFLPLDGPPSLNIPIPTTSPFFTEELITPLEETEEEQTKVLGEQRPTSQAAEGLVSAETENNNNNNNTQTQQQHSQARALRSVMAYLRDMSDLTAASATGVGNMPSAMPSSASLANPSSSDGADARARRPTIADSRSVSEFTGSPLSTYTDESRMNTMSIVTTDSNGSKGEEDRKYKEDKSRRVKIIKEIVQTERTYVQGLQELIDIYVKPAAVPINTFAATKETVIPQQERKMVFNGLDSLHTFHTQSFLPALERAAKSIVPESKKDKFGKPEADPEVPTEISMNAAVAIAHVFVSYAAFMKMYSTYINNFDNAFERLKQWTQDRRVPGSSVTSPNASTVHLAGPGSNTANSSESNSPGLQPLTSSQRKRIKQYLKRCRMSPNHSQISLEAYLLLPVQRIPRYRMLLDELVRCTPPKPELPSDVMEKALSEIASLANNMNEGKREAESRRRLVQWQSRIRGKFPSPLVQPHRRLIMDGSLTLTRVVRKTSMTFDVATPGSDAATVQIECLAPEETPRSLVGILCNDLLVLCKDPSGGQDPTAQVDLWAVLRMQTRPVPASITQGNSLRIVDNKAILYFDAPSTSQALTWCRAINMHIPLTFT